MNNKSEIITWGGMSCVKLSAGGYEAIIANEIGSNVIRLRDNKNGLEFFRYSDKNDADVIRQSAEVWGLPTLYLPNRFADGVLKASDAVYHLPVNEKAPYNNHIHGFLHKRAHEVVEYSADDNCAWVKTRYVYDEKDEFFKYLPVRFTAEYTFTLSAQGLEQNIRFINTDGMKVLPMSLASHTTINSPFVDGAKEEDIRLTVPIGKRCELNERCLPLLPIRNLKRRKNRQIGSIGKAALDMSVTRQANTIAGGAVAVRNRTDEADGSRCSGNAVIDRRAEPMRGPYAGSLGRHFLNRSCISINREIGSSACPLHAFLFWRKVRPPPIQKVLYLLIRNRPVLLPAT